MADLLFQVGLALLITHELDAIQRQEWRLIPFLCRLEDNTAYRVFVLLHIPLFTTLLWLQSHPSPAVQHGFQLGVDLFLILHLGLHILLRHHPENEFKTLLSKSIIALAALTGLLHLTITSLPLQPG